MTQKPYRIGIDLGGTNIKVGVVDKNNVIVAKKSCKTLAMERTWQEVIAAMADLVWELLPEAGVEIEQCEKIGVGSPGMIDYQAGVVVFAGNFGWEDIPLITELRRYFELPMRIANDANCAVLGEAVAGAAKGAHDVVMLTLGTGVGGGVVTGGVLQHGGSAGGLELGHTLLVVDGEECTCGRKGCLEAYASANALKSNARAAMQKHPESLMAELCKGEPANMNGKIPFEAANNGDEAAKYVVQSYIKHLGEGIINFINIWRPEKFLLGGGVSNEGDGLFVPLNEYVRPRVFAAERGYTPPIIRAALGNDAGLIGAVSL